MAGDAFEVATRRVSLPSRTRILGARLIVVATTLSAIVTGAQAQPSRRDFQLIDEGFRLFTQETFGGNGRTCSTCHIPAVDYNIFPSTIATLSTRERDLVFAKNVPGLENVDLVRSRALFNISGSADTYRADQANLFGTEDHGPVFRSSMGIQALELTSNNTSPNFPGTPLQPQECSFDYIVTDPGPPPRTSITFRVTQLLAQLGWSGDAPPGTPRDIDGPLLSEDLCHAHHGNHDPKADGSIRAFANGAIAQHNTKSLNRIEGQDFRFATDQEADALQAFQKWLGRRALTGSETAHQGVGNGEFDVTHLHFQDAGGRINKGRDHFVGAAECTTVACSSATEPNPNAGAGCHNCHSNGGARVVAVGGANNAGQNTNISTDVELGSAAIGLQLVGFALPHDEGADDSFGAVNPLRDGDPDPRFNDSFNVQSLIEAPRKEAWFHNHRALGNFEQAIEFYLSENFQCGDDDHNPATCDNPAAAFTREPVMRFGNAVLRDTHTTKLISFPNGDGVEHLGAFLRALSAFYSLRDCERLIGEMRDRIKVGASINLPRMHCSFALNDVDKVIRGIKLRPIPFLQVLPHLKAVDRMLNEVPQLVAKNRSNPKLALWFLSGIRSYVENLRDAIATVAAP